MYFYVSYELRYMVFNFSTGPIINCVMDRYNAVANHLYRLRELELDLVSHLFLKHMSVLEIGGGNGFQASKISEWGCNVYSIDIKNRENQSMFFDVRDYDGKNIPFEDRKFDIIFTSNVLEHVVDINNILCEFKRVLNPNGFAICIMPTSSWRIWSILSYYPYLVGAMLKRMLKKNNSHPLTITAFPPSHGAYKSSFQEVYYYSKYHWTKVFNNNGLNLIDCYSNGYFCTLYAIFPNLGIKYRKIIRNILGYSGNIFIVQQSN